MLVLILTIIFPALIWCQDLAFNGYVRAINASVCMEENCVSHSLEDEFGNFLSYISTDNDSFNLSYFINRFVEIEGDSTSCTECNSVNITQIKISSNCQSPVNCFSNPCLSSYCHSDLDAQCIPNYCGGCWSDYYLNENLIICETQNGCTDLSFVNFGLCNMALGIGWKNNNCEYISGCDWVVNNIDYTDAFFTSMDECQQICISLRNDHSTSFPVNYYLHENYPNPFNPITTIEYDLSEDAYVNIIIYDILGNPVNKLLSQNQKYGSNSIQWDATNNQGLPVPAGVYLYKIRTGDFSQTKKMILLK